MRHGPLRVTKPVQPAQDASNPGQPPFLLTVADDEGSFNVIGSRWVRERWAGAAPVEPTTPQQMDAIQAMMLREADRRRHDGAFDLEHPMTLDR